MAANFAILPIELLQLLSSSSSSDNVRLEFLRLPHPRTGLPALFLPTESIPSSSTPGSDTGILEIQSISPPDERSWILDEDVFADGKMLTMTPIDPAFLFLPILKAAETATDGNTPFRTGDDIFEAAAEKMIPSNYTDKFLREHLLRFGALDCTRTAMARLCEFKELTADIVVYRPSTEKCIKYLRAKISHLETSPVINASKVMTRSLAREGLMEDGNEDMLQVGRTRACCDLLSQYLSPDLRDALLKSYDFTAFQKFIELKREEAVRMAGENAPPKAKGRVAKGKPDEKETSTTAKKRKATKSSHGVESLKKVNTTSMPKLSSFFEKKA